MTTSGGASDEDTEEAQVVMSTGIRHQRLSIVGWFASHADTGTPGPHVNLRTNDGRNPVLKTSQIPELVEGLAIVVERIDHQWQRDEDDFLSRDFVGARDDNDPAVIRQGRVAELVFFERLAAQIEEVVAILIGSEDLIAASEPIARLLAVDVVEVEARLSRLSLFGLTRSARIARSEELARLSPES